MPEATERRPLRWAPQPARVLLALQCVGALAAGAIARSLGAGWPLALAVAAATPFLTHGAALAGGFLGSWWACGRPRPWRPWLRTFLREWPRSMWMVYGALAWQESFALPAPPPPVGASPGQAPVVRAAGAMATAGPAGTKATAGAAGAEATACAAAGPAVTPKGPVLLIHGFSCHRGVWSVAARWFVASGRHVEALSLRPAHGAIDAAVASVHEAVARLQATAGADVQGPPPLVHLVGHSMGGLVARAYLRRHGWDGIGAVVTLATPHRGTWQARYGFGEASRQMRRDSPWLRDLAASEPPAPPRRMLVVTSRQDNIVSWPAIQTLPVARHVLLEGLGHMGFLLEPRVITLVLHFLDAVERRSARKRRVTPDPPGQRVRTGRTPSAG